MCGHGRGAVREGGRGGLVGGDGARRRCAQHHEQLGARDGAAAAEGRGGGGVKAGRGEREGGRGRATEERRVEDGWAAGRGVRTRAAPGSRGQSTRASSRRPAA